MSGTISFSDTSVWGASGTGYRVILAEIIADLRAAGRSVSLVAYLEDPDGLPQAIDYLPLHEASPEWRAAFSLAASTAYQRCRDEGVGVPLDADYAASLLPYFRSLILAMREIYELSSPNAAA